MKFFCNSVLGFLAGLRFGEGVALDLFFPSATFFAFPFLEFDFALAFAFALALAAGLFMGAAFGFGTGADGKVKATRSSLGVCSTMNISLRDIDIDNHRHI